MRALAFSHRGLVIREALRAAVLELQRAHIESASLDARILLEHVLSVSRERLLLLLDDILTAEQEAFYFSMIAERARRKPVAQLIGKREFWGMNFKVTSATLDPRPDSETLIEALLKRELKRDAPLSILDLGTGTGCLLLALLKEFPKATGVGVDISEEALRVARENAKSHDLDTRAAFLHSNWCENVTGRFDVIISNPPYIPSEAIAKLAPEVAQFEPTLALDGGEDGLEPYRAIFAKLPDVMAADAIAAFEMGAGQQFDIETLAARYGLRQDAVKQDMQGIPRCILIKSSHQQ